MKKKQKQHEAQYNAQTRVQFNTFELHNLAHAYAYYLRCHNGPVENSLMVKLASALKRCEDQAHQTLCNSKQKANGKGN